MTELAQHLEALREDWHGAVHGARLDDVGAARIAQRARRSRTTRTALTWASGAVAVTVVAVAAWVGMGATSDDAPPAQTPSPVTTEPTTGPSTEPSPTPPASAQLPVMPPVTEEVWAEVTDGWTLVSLSGTEAAGNFTPIYLVDPAGQAYALPSLDPDMTVLQWIPGEREAWFSQCCDASIMRVDLDTGQELPMPQWFVESGAIPWSVLSDGRISATDEAGSAQLIVGPDGVVTMPDIEGRLSPDGALLASSSGVTDTHTGKATPLTGYDADGRCYPMGWYDATTVAIACGDRDDAGGLIYNDGSVLLGDALTGEVRDGAWPEQPGDAGVDVWATTGYVVMPDGSILVGVGGDPWAGNSEPNRHETPTLPSRSQPHLLSPDGILRALAVPGLEPECALLIPPRTDGGLIPIRDLCVEDEPRLGGLFRLQDGELVPAIPIAEMIGEVSRAGVSGWAG